MLIVISGLPGTGKSTVAAAVADELDGVHLSVDLIEDALLGAGLPRSRQTGVAAYEAVRAAAEQNLAAGRTVVVDAVNDSEAARDTWRRVTVRCGAGVRAPDPGRPQRTSPSSGGARSRAHPHSGTNLGRSAATCSVLRTVGYELPARWRGCLDRRADNRNPQSTANDLRVRASPSQGRDLAIAGIGPLCWQRLLIDVLAQLPEVAPLDIDAVQVVANEPEQQVGAALVAQHEATAVQEVAHASEALVERGSGVVARQ